ncbi:MAG: radical SAM family heme chaperone HemW [Oligoflexales bacterium]
MQPFGIYIHIPFCRSICHYCQFVKTAHFSKEFSTQYFDQVKRSLRVMLENITAQKSGLKLVSIFFGGGTPGMFTEPYGSILSLISSYFNLEGVEISLEANPEDLKRENLDYWAETGFNRLSVGIQSFNERHLKFLTRYHSSARSFKAVEEAKSVFANINIDLIYGIPSQTPQELAHDLEMFIGLDLAHLSLYGLTYEPKTTLGRKQQRGIITAAADTTELTMYADACRTLAAKHYDHDEVSNWSKSGFHTVHNALYWKNNYYIGAGAGAHSYLPSEEAIGIRFKNTDSLVGFNSQNFDGPQDWSKWLATHTAIDMRDRSSWLDEYLGSSLRTKEGASLQKIKDITRFSFSPHPIIEQGIEEGCLQISGDFIRLTESEWFREASWASYASLSFR